MTALRSLVVVGGSLAGLRAVEAAREVGYEGRITIVGRERHLPYDRPPLSKKYLDEDAPEDLPLHLSAAALDELGAELVLGEPASALDADGRRVAVGDEWIGYDALVIATGAVARTLPGTQGTRGVHTLRKVEDATAVREALDRGARTVVIGAGFIGSEIATAARKRGLSVTLLEAMRVPLAHAIGAEMGEAVSRLHERNGARLHCGVAVSGVSGERQVEGVVLTDGTELEADLVVVGIGAVPATDWLRSSPLDVADGVACDDTLNTGVPGVYAAGDVAKWNSKLFGRALRIEHWTVAEEQGRLAARNALAPELAQPYDAVPYFWSDCYGNRIQFAGVAEADEVAVVEGDADSTRFTALYRSGDRLGGVLTMNRPGQCARFQALLASGADWETALSRAKPGSRGSASQIGRLNR